LGNKPLGAPPQAKEFEAFSHYSEQRNRLFGQHYFYKAKDAERGYLIKAVTRQDFDQRLVPELKINTKLMENTNGALLKYHGSVESLPSMDKRPKELVLMKFDPYDYDLEYELTNRIVKKRFFTNLEIWSLIFVGIKGLASIQEAGSYHGSVCTRAIVIDKLDFKMIYPKIICSPSTNLFPYTDLSVFSEDIRAGLKPESYNIELLSKIDVFFLGLMLLEACTLQNFTESKTIEVKDINEALLNLKMEYSDEIFRIVREMLVLRINNRPDAIKLNKIIETRIGFTSGDLGRAGKQ